MVTSLPGLMFQKTLRGVKKARKQAQRGAKLARYVAGRVRSAEKSLRDSSGKKSGGVIMVRCPRCLRVLARGSGPHPPVVMRRPDDDTRQS